MIEPTRLGSQSFGDKNRSPSLSNVLMFKEFLDRGDSGFQVRYQPKEKRIFEDLLDRIRVSVWA